ncbi:MAG: protein kinase [Chitinivibrionales bacterium]|nr:protein kinase [Chitinivibrionales bacterium]MBD3397195.1 protein kinase [Chitinivibrionales bacterium]
MAKPNASHNEDNWVPAQLGNYRILERLGRGGMGDIYKAIQAPLGRTVALKVLSPQLMRNDEFAKRFEIEAKAISLLQHNNIVSIYEYGEVDGLKFFAMQFVEGEDLGRRIARKKPVPVEEIIDTAKQICRGLRYAHSKNVVHRDIKPQNVLIDKNGVCRLSDFGIAKIFESTNLTMTGMAVGTPEYMSPEQAEGEQLDAQTDIYSLGIVIFEMLTKRPPFTGSNPVAIAYKQVHEVPVAPSTSRKDTPKRLELIVLKALKKNIKERYRSAEEMLADLDTVDINDVVVRPTVSFSLHKRQAKTGRGRVEKRITDRRYGDRRRDSLWEYRTVFTWAFWADLIRAQGLSLALIIILAVILAIHMLNHP